MSDPVCETELKFEIGPQAEHALRTHPAIAAAPRTTTLRSTYFDTPRRHLLDRGVRDGGPSPVPPPLRARYYAELALIAFHFGTPDERVTPMRERDRSRAKLPRNLVEAFAKLEQKLQEVATASTSVG